MKHWLSAEGEWDLKGLRLSDTVPEVTYEPAPIRLLARVPSEECGCPEELWQVEGLTYLIHMEEDGSSEMFMFGDGEYERSSEAKTLDALRADMFAWHAEIMEREKT